MHFDSTDLIESDSNEDGSSTLRQLHLFWWKNPDFIIWFVQCILSGFAMLLAFLGDFGNDISKSAGVQAEKAHALAIMSLLCFFTFVFIMTKAIPRFTLCTSIGRLVEKNTLHQLLAKYRLKKALQKIIELQEKMKFIALRRKTKASVIYQAAVAQYLIVCI